MAQSPEYPDLKWVVPRSWTNSNRTSVQLIVIHDTEGSSHGQSAEDGAAYDSRRTDGTSAHYFVDNNSIVQCVRTNDNAHTARSQGNRRGIQYELCARANWTKAKWLSADYGRPMLERAARQCARDAKKWGIPIRKLTVAQVARGDKGFCGHADITRAFPADRGTHTDPGPNFPWSEFIAMVQKAAGVTPPKPAPKPPASGSLPNHKLGSRTLRLTDPQMSGTDIAQYQRFIGVEDDGWFGPDTEEATREYQEMRGYEVDGIAGPQTLGPIVKALA